MWNEFKRGIQGIIMLGMIAMLSYLLILGFAVIVAITKMIFRV